MTISLDALVTPLTRKEIESSIYQVLAAVGVNTTAWKPGSVVRTMITGVSVVLSAFSQLQAKIARSGFLELSEGDWLSLVAHHVYGVDRFEATFAAGEITLTNSGGGLYDLEPFDLVVSNLATGKTYRNTEAFSLGANTQITIPIRATEAGAASTSLASTIGELETQLLGVSCNNALALVGLDAESDPDLRLRCYEKLGALSPMGPWDAYAFAARNAKRADGTAVGVTRVRQHKDGAGGVTTWVATATGAVLGDPDDLDTDLGAVNEAIQQLAAPLAVTAVVESATAVEIPLAYEVWIYNTSGLTDEQLTALIEGRVVAFLATQPIGGNVIGLDSGKVFVNALEAVIFGTRPEIFEVVISVPTENYELSSNEVPILTSTPSGSVHQIPPPERF
jgi:hypothetical protein